MANLFSDIPDELPNELFQDIVSSGAVRIERILSKGQASPESGWYDQDEHEWVLLLSGYGVIEFEDGRLFTLRQGDYLNIAAHQKHRVRETSADDITLWLAVFYKS